MSKTLTKQKIIEALSEKLNVPFATAKRLVQGTLDLIFESLQNERRVELRDFGVFEVVARKGRVAQNIQKKTKVYVPDRKVVKFKQGRLMQERITRPSMNNAKVSKESSTSGRS